MNKRIISILSLMLILGAGSLFAIGIGAQAGYVAGPNYSNGALTFKLDSTPWVFALNVDGMSNHYLGIGLTADRWIANKTIERPLAYYYGWGLAGSFVSVDDQYTSVFLGARALIGINAFLVDKFLELYAQVAWQPGIVINLNGNNGMYLDAISFPVNVGFRFWI
ncbi:MAG TPA: hypothetical protein VJ861_00010 [Treponemataceae bacterium]|nr:hypothetical protein [Treponemataceae bacterium]